MYLFEQADELLAGIRLSDDHLVDLLVVQERALLSTFWGTTLLLVGHGEAAAPHLITSAEQALRMGRIAALAGNSDMVGWPGASQPPAPTDPYVTVSRHTALVALII